MMLTRWDPFRDLTRLQDRINRLFDESFPALTGKEEEGILGTWSPDVDIYETDKAVVLKADLPGIKKEDLSVEVKDNILTLRGERKFEKEVKRDNYYRAERAYGSFQRAFSLPATVRGDKIKAKFKNGVLEIEIPKIEEAKPKRIAIDVE
ncbi:MAG: Hsp20/alpha crystallin family protein [Deltaproteobacteria bacterium]|nr:Hsp20/alpha crystallin family protein [Deltaproteobacteria bacterium]